MLTMKKNSLTLWCSCIFALACFSMQAQNSIDQNEKTSVSDEDDAPIVYKFEPDFEDKNEQRKAELVRTRKIIDTLQVSDRKRYKLLKDLYKNGVTKRLQKALLVETTFEDSEHE